MSIGLLCAVALVVGSLSVFFSVAYTSYVATLLSADRLVAGNQRLELSESAAQVIGPTIGGTILQLAGVPPRPRSMARRISSRPWRSLPRAPRRAVPVERRVRDRFVERGSARASGGSPTTGSCATSPDRPR